MLLGALCIAAPRTCLDGSKLGIIMSIGRGRVFHVPVRGVRRVVAFNCVKTDPKLVGLYTSGGISLAFLSPRKECVDHSRNPAEKGILLEGTRCGGSSRPGCTLRLDGLFVKKGVRGCHGVLHHFVESGKSSRTVRHIYRRLLQYGEEILGTRSVSDIEKVRKRTTAACFNMFSHLLLGRGRSFMFRNHGHHPPGSTVGTVLSFMCALVYGSVASTLRAINLSPCMKFVRALEPKHTSLSLSVVRRLQTCLNSELILSLVGEGRVAVGSFVGRNSRNVIVASSKHGVVLST